MDSTEPRESRRPEEWLLEMSLLGQQSALRGLPAGKGGGGHYS